MRVKVKSKVIPASFLKTEGRGTLFGVKDRKERDGQWNWLVIRTQVLKDLPETKEAREEGAKEMSGEEETQQGEQLQE